MKAGEIVSILSKKFPNPKCELNFNSTFQLLVAVILSAQCTDKRVNMVTEKLFQKYKTPNDFANISQSELESLIFSCGFYHNKAKAIISMSTELIENYNGIVPDNLEELQKLSGVGRKTANVVYSVAFEGDAIAVDTHVYRTSHRLGLTKSNNPLDCEKDLMKFFDKKDWSNIHYLLVLFGRYVCKSKNPDCKNCEFRNICTELKEKQNVCR